ncbi:MAG: DNA repair protein RadC [Verrucomicrobiota bacterium]|nr:DNA repair protein RadC [Verrucomicrobiota bacterium]
MTLRELPPDARPRERLAQRGPAALSSIELIAILLSSGTKKRSALELAADLLARFGTLEQLAEATLAELSTIKGIGFAKAIQLQASFALWKRLRPPATDRSLIDSPEKAFDQLCDLSDEPIEVLCVLLRDARRALLHKEIIGKGILNQVMMHPREVFCSAIRHRAHSLIIAHNHPSGDPEPSTSDREITHTLCSAGMVVGIPVVDHLIIGKGTFYSFRRKGLLKGSSFEKELY